MHSPHEARSRLVKILIIIIYNHWQSDFSLGGGWRVQKKKVLFIIVFNDNLFFFKFKFVIFLADMIFNFRKIINFGIYTTIYSYFGTS